MATKLKDSEKADYFLYEPDRDPVRIDGVDYRVPNADSETGELFDPLSADPVIKQRAIKNGKPQQSYIMSSWVNWFTAAVGWIIRLANTKGAGLGTSSARLFSIKSLAKAIPYIIPDASADSYDGNGNKTADGERGSVKLASLEDVKNKVSPRNDVVLTPLSHAQYAKSFQATTAEAGQIELATNTEADAGTDTKRAITPATLGHVLKERLDVDIKTQGRKLFATQAEVDAGTEDAKAVSPATLQAKKAGISKYGIVELASLNDITEGTSYERAVTPQGLHHYIPAVHREGSKKATRMNYSFQHLLEDDFTVTGQSESQLAKGIYGDIGGSNNEYSMFRVMIGGLITNVDDLKLWEGKPYAAWEATAGTADTEVSNGVTSALTLFGVLKDTFEKAGGDFKSNLPSNPVLRLLFQKESANEWKVYLGIKHPSIGGTYWLDDTYNAVSDNFGANPRKGVVDKDEFPFFDHPYAISDEMMYYDTPSKKAQHLNVVFPQVLLAEHLHSKVTKKDFFKATIPKGSTILFMCSVNDRGSDTAKYNRTFADGTNAEVKDHTETYTMSWGGHAEAGLNIVLSSKYVNSQAELLFRQHGQDADKIDLAVHLVVNRNKAGTAAVNDDDYFEYVLIQYLGTAEHEH